MVYVSPELGVNTMEDTIQKQGVWFQTEAAGIMHMVDSCGQREALGSVIPLFADGQVPLPS